MCKARPSLRVVFHGETKARTFDVHGKKTCPANALNSQRSHVTNSGQSLKTVCATARSRNARGSRHGSLRNSAKATKHRVRRPVRLDSMWNAREPRSLTRHSQRTCRNPRGFSCRCSLNSLSLAGPCSTAAKPEGAATGCPGAQATFPAGGGGCVSLHKGSPGTVLQPPLPQGEPRTSLKEAPRPSPLQPLGTTTSSPGRVLLEPRNSPAWWSRSSRSRRGPLWSVVLVSSHLLSRTDAISRSVASTCVLAPRTENNPTTCRGR